MAAALISIKAAFAAPTILKSLAHRVHAANRDTGHTGGAIPPRASTVVSMQ